MQERDDSPEMKFRGTFSFQSLALARDLEADILSARTNGAPIIELRITRDDGKPSRLTVEVLDDAPVANDTGTVYRCHLHPYRGDEVQEVTILIPNPSDLKRALVSVSY